MRVLLFAYTCEPGNGSEPGTGWVWSRMLARMGEVWAITCEYPNVAAVLKRRCQARSSCLQRSAKRRTVAHSKLDSFIERKNATVFADCPPSLTALKQFSPLRV
jgi:hypothetical protein